MLDMNGSTLHKLVYTHPENVVRQNEIERLQKKIAKLIPVADTLVRLIKLRANSIGTSSKLDRRSNSIFPFHAKSENEAASEPLLDLAASVDPKCLEACLHKLNNLYFNSDIEDTEVRKQLADIRNKVDLIHQRLNGLFNDSIGPISIRGDVIEMYFSRIGHLEYKKEAESNRKVISMLLESINRLLETAECPPESSPTISTTKLLKLDVLEDRASAVIGAMIAIELRRLHVEQLVLKDRRRRNKTLLMFPAYILVIAIFVIILPLITTIFPKLSDIPLLGFIKGINVVNSNQPLSSQSIHLLGIPAAVIIWSFIGSFAATIHRFNRRSVYYFDDATKWMITRHVQGIVLSSAFYLILNSGLFSFFSVNNQTSIKNEVILVLSFLIGFSDRFVDSVFDTLIERYSGKSKSPEPKSNLDDRDSE